MKKYLNLVRHIAWSFHRTTGIDWEELFGEASLAYCEALQSYHSEKSRESTWIFHCVRNRLITFCKEEAKNECLPGVRNWNGTTIPTPDYEFFEDRFDGLNLSEDVKWIIRMVLRNPQRYAINSRKAMGIIGRDLRNRKGWTYHRIWNGMKNLRVELNEIS